MKYQDKKEQVRDEAIDWQGGYQDHNFSYSELANFGEYFERLGKRYGLLKEFKENGII